MQVLHEQVDKLDTSVGPNSVYVGEFPLYIITVCMSCVYTTFHYQVKAIYDFSPSSGCSDELAMRKDDVIIVLSKTDPNWWMGRNKSNGSEGLFPANHVKIINN